MGRGWAVGFAVCAACGRFGFGDRPDARPDGFQDVDAVQPQDARSCLTPSGHDEDGDSIDDSCDVCPHLADNQADGDGDLVGDACDPEPGNARQSIALFDPFIDQRPGWTLSDNDVTIDATGLHFADANSYSEYRRSYVAGDDLFIVGAAMTGVGTGSYHFQIELMSAGVPYFYCELFDNGSDVHTLAMTWTDDGTTYLHGSTPMAQPHSGGSGTLAMAVTSSAVTCNTTWRTDSVQAMAAHPDAPPVRLLLSSSNADVDVDYFVQIRSQ